MKDLKSLLRRITRLRILVVGDMMLDHYIWGDATRISPEAPVPVIDIARDTWTAGGAANVALNLASLGAHCTVAGYIGDDEAGHRLTTILKAKDIQTIPTPGQAPTIVKTRVLVRHQQLCRLDREASPGSYEISAGRVDALLAGPKSEFREWENVPYFDGCLPIEVMAERGRETLRHGPMKPVGLTNAHRPDDK
ncbi:MAG: hypothetical protein EBR23_15750, partial [Planctomycetia bacterium]|nr:hypothetical protein [Planctomycetia bacterium]